MKNFLIASWLITVTTIIFYAISRMKWANYAEKRYREGYLERDTEEYEKIKERLSRKHYAKAYTPNNQML